MSPVFVMKRLLAATVVLASLTGVAFAQEGKDDDPIVIEQKQKKKDAEEVDKRYKSTLDKTRKDATGGRIDPWSNMRGADDSKAKR
jgi:hypothetical protein